MLNLTIALLVPLISSATAPDHRESTARLLARQALTQQDAEAVLSGCNFDRLISRGVFACYSANLGPKAVCDDGSRSAPYYVVEGYLDVELQPQIGKILYREACAAKGQ